MGKLIRFSFCILLLLTPLTAGAGEAEDMQLLFMKAFAKKKVAAPSQLNVDLTIDGQPHDQVMVFVNKQQTFDRVKADDLLPKLKPALKAAVYERLIKDLGKQEKISFDWLSKQDLKARYDSANLSLDIVIKPSLREPLILSLLESLSSTVRNDNKVEPSNVSGYLNLYSNAELSLGEAETTQDLQLRLEGSLTVGKVNLQSNLTKNSDEWKLSNTYFTYDEPDKLRRYRLGDVNTVTSNFQESLSLTGASLSKEFALDKSRGIHPRASENLILSTRSDVIVLLNKHQLRRYTLAAGTYRLEDIGLNEGQNDIELKIIDAFGKETIKKSSQLFDARLLKPGLSKYAFSVGMQKDSNKLAVTGTYRYGVSDTLTMGRDAQLLRDQYLFGAEALVVLNQGSYLGGVALSGDLAGDKIGAAARVAFKSNNLRDKQAIRWKMGGEYRSRLFNPSLGDTAGESDAVKYNLQLSLQKQLYNQWHSSLSINHSNFYQAQDAFVLNLNTSKRFGKNISYKAGIAYNREDNWSVNTQLSVLLSGKSGRKKRLGLISNSKNKMLETRYEVKAKNAIGRDSLSGNLIYRKSATGHEERAEGSVRHTRFDSRFSASNRHNGNVNQQVFQIGINTSLACAGRQCAMTYPIEDSFALVGGPKNQQQAIPLNTGNRRFVYADDDESLLPLSYTALIAKRGSKAVVHLEDYRTQRISVDEISLPFGYDPEKTEFEASPKYRQGFNFNVGGEPGTVVDGILVNAAGEPLGFKGGQWVSVNNADKAIAFFSNKSGKFRLSSIAPGKYNLDLHDYPEMERVEITVKPTDNGIQKLEKITIRH